MSIKVVLCLVGRGWVGELNKCFPNFCLLKNENFDNVSELSKHLVEIIMGDDITVFIIDADQQNRGANF